LLAENDTVATGGALSPFEQPLAKGRGRAIAPHHVNF
jgi:hypothetical protein